MDFLCCLGVSHQNFQAGDILDTLALPAGASLSEWPWAECLLCPFDIPALSPQDTFARAKNWVKELQRQASPNIVIALAGNKADLASKRAVEFQVWGWTGPGGGGRQPPWIFPRLRRGFRKGDTGRQQSRVYLLSSCDWSQGRKELSFASPCFLSVGYARIWIAEASYLPVNFLNETY